MEGSEQPAETSGVSKRYMIFLVVLMGLISNMDSWLSLIESKALPSILGDFFGITSSSSDGAVAAEVTLNKKELRTTRIIKTQILFFSICFT